MKRGTSAVYAAGFLQGAVFVLIPALGPILRAAPYRLSDAAYGMLYIPEIVGAIIAALAAGSVREHFGGAWLFRLGVLSNAAAMALLAAAYFVKGETTVVLLLAETLLLGVGFGVTNASINRTASFLFAGAATTAVTLLNAVIGGATAVSPLILEAIQKVWSWALWPGVLGGLWLLVLLLPKAEDIGKERSGLRAWHVTMLPFAAAVLVYAVAEGSFGSWVNVLVTVDHHLSTGTGALALSLFWGGMTIARFALGAIPDHLLPRRKVYLMAPLGMGACFLLIPHIDSAAGLIGAFTAAGMSCGIYYPYSMAYGIASHRDEGTQMAGLLVGALMVGEGIGSFGLGPLQKIVSLGTIYSWSSVWALPLLWLAWRNSRPASCKPCPRG